MPYVLVAPGARSPAAQVVVRNPGGAYSDAQKEYIYDPFTKETGIEVVVVPTTMAKMLAMVKSGTTELDVADAGFDGLLTMNWTRRVRWRPSTYASVEVRGRRRTCRKST